MPNPTLDALLWWTLKGSAIVAFAGIATLLLRRRPAALRHGVWAVAVIAQLALPFTERVPAVPVMTVSVPPLQLAGTAEAIDPKSMAAPPEPVRGPAIPITITGGLALVSALLLLRLVAGTMRVMTIARRSARVVDGEWLSLVQELCAATGIRRPVTLIRSERIALPMTWGVLYPTILLPTAAGAWPRELRRSVLLHELAHVRRLDALTQLASQLALALFWFNPLVWVAARRARAEAEHACDDYVLRGGERPSVYAATLVTLVEAHRGASLPAFASLAVGRRSELEERVGALTSPHRDPSASRVLVASAIVAAAVIVAPLSALHRTFDAQPAGGIPCTPMLLDAGTGFRETSGTLTRKGTTTHYYFLRPTPRRCVEVSYSLAARFTADDRDLVPDQGLDALLREVTVDGAKHARVTARQRQFFIDGRPAAWDEAWYRRMVAESVRLTSAGIADRTARIVARGGADALFAEVRRIPASMSVRRHYLEALLSLQDASKLPRERVAEEARIALTHPPELAAFLSTLEGDQK